MSNTRKATEKKPTTLDDILGQVQRAERVVPICVRGDLMARHQELEMEAVAAEDDDLNQSRLGSEAKAPKVAKRIKDLEAEMRKYTYDFRFRAIRPKEWSDLIAKHPDPKGQLRVDLETFRPVAIAACCVEPDGMGDVEAVKGLLEELQAGQVDELFDAAWGVNQQTPGKANSYIASSILQTSERSSTTASRLGSPGVSSSDG